MAREFTKNMLIMLVAIMIGVFVITYFAADIINRSKIETLTTGYVTEIKDINSMNENFTNYFLQGSVKMDSAREIREVGNYYFDLAARIWYPQGEYQKVIGNCTNAMSQYLISNLKFAESKPYFIAAKTFTENPSYKGALDYYVAFANSGENITLLRYEAAKYLLYASENLSLGNVENATFLLENFSILESHYDEMLGEYNEYKDLIDHYIFFEEDRTKPEG